MWIGVLISVFLPLILRAVKTIKRGGGGVTIGPS
jgi:hypothetical protein